ncbi:hypothetical protein LRS13_04930 [Svornostia abyssi]|uniref:DUF7144 domain-containing protein n=1 Tax=Svornostia abyssi TaxID=2898438 RepID=A0ABY5PJN5_9ACTN|nr:hypothetical protein LRS13_04930 [Parviterribacteraceae bacterium J379]
MEASRPAGAGWFTFAGVLFLIAGVANLLWGIGALDDASYLPEDGLLFSNLTFWGWVSIIWGAVSIVGGGLLLSRSAVGAIMGIFIATLSAFFWMFSLPVLPIWSLVVITIDLLIIYGLSAHIDAAK